MLENVRFGLMDPMKFIIMVQNLFSKNNQNDHSIIKQILTDAIYIVNHCILYEYQSYAKNILFELINELILSNSSLKDFLINSLLEVIEHCSKAHMDYLISTIKEENPSQKENDDNNFLVEQDSFTNISINRQVSFELGIETDFLNYDTKLRILEMIYESKYVLLEKKKKLRRAITFNDSNFKEETFIDDTLEACLPDEQVK